MGGLGAIAGSLGLLALIVGLIMFMPLPAFKVRRTLAKWLALGGLVAFIFGLAVSPAAKPNAPAAASLPSSVPSKSPSTEASAKDTAAAVTARAEPLPEPDPEDALSGPQRNALRSARQYLATSGFSRRGLIGQLSSDAGDGYSVADATAAVDALNEDWKEHAARSARQYLEMSGFSCKGLVQQLSSSAGDRYTVEEATYGARQAGACS